MQNYSWTRLSTVNHRRSFPIFFEGRGGCTQAMPPPPVPRSCAHIFSRAFHLRVTPTIWEPVTGYCGKRYPHFEQLVRWSSVGSRFLSPASRLSCNIAQYRGSQVRGSGFVSLQKQGVPQLMSPFYLNSLLSYLFYHLGSYRTKTEAYRNPSDRTTEAKHCPY